MPRLRHIINEDDLERSVASFTSGAVVVVREAMVESWTQALRMRRMDELTACSLHPQPHSLYTMPVSTRAFWMTWIYHCVSRRGALDCLQCPRAGGSLRLMDLMCRWWLQPEMVRPLPAARSVLACVWGG